MPKIPRDLSGKELASLLEQFGYRITRQTGSHIRLTSNTSDKEHHITIPDHTPLKIGTLNKERHITIPDHTPLKIGALNAIIRDITGYLKIDRQLFIQKLLKH